jgi:hypothetical protein
VHVPPIRELRAESRIRSTGARAGAAAPDRRARPAQVREGGDGGLPRRPPRLRFTHTDDLTGGRSLAVLCFWRRRGLRPGCLVRGRLLPSLEVSAVSQPLVPRRKCSGRADWGGVQWILLQFLHVYDRLQEIMAQTY